MCERQHMSKVPPSGFLRLTKNEVDESSILSDVMSHQYCHTYHERRPAEGQGWKTLVLSRLQRKCLAGEQAEPGWGMGLLGCDDVSIYICARQHKLSSSVQPRESVDKVAPPLP